MRVGEGFIFEGLIFNNEMAYETISETELGLNIFYNDNIRLITIITRQKWKTAIRI